MARDTLRTAISGASFLLVLSMTLLFLYAQTLNESPIFPQDITRWNQILTVYLVVFAISLIISYLYAKDILISMVRANYWKSFLTKFLPSALATYIFLIMLKMIVKRTINPMDSLSYMNPGIILFHLFVVSQIEELLFGGLIFRSIEKKSGDKTANILTILAFMFWHFAKTGGNIIVMIIYAPLRWWWNYISRNGTPVLSRILPQFFGPTPQTQQANAGSHFAWNFFVIGG